MFSVKKESKPSRQAERLRADRKRNEAIAFLARKRFSRAIISTGRNGPGPEDSCNYVLGSLPRWLRDKGYVSFTTL